MISLLFFGFVFSFLGFTLPSVLNMTALKISLNDSKKEFTKFTLGVSLVVFIQVYISIYIIQYLSDNLIFIRTLFLWVFFYQH